MDAATSITTRDGRRLAYLEVGESDGPLVLHNHGGPSSRLEARLFADVAAQHRLRFVCADRPGMGQSSPQRHRTYAGWAEDLTALADALGHQQFGVTGWSEGGPWALAAAAYLAPDRLRHVSSIAGGSYGALGENWASKYLSRADSFGGFLALRFKPGFRLMYGSLGLAAKHASGSFLKQLRRSVNEYDREILERPEFAAAFGATLAECFAHGSGGLVEDSELLYRRWAFDVANIERRVHMWQGTDDRLVPAPINQAVADRMPGAVWHSVDGAGHFVAVGAAEQVFAIVAAELAA
jgi:pimeloyl-ACP methyl ester carboxylesterase